MTHTKGNRMDFDDIAVGSHYIIVHSDGDESYVRITSKLTQGDPDDYEAHYRVLELRKSDGQWSPFSVSVPYHPAGHFYPGTISGDNGLKVYEVTEPVPKRRRRSPY